MQRLRGAARPATAGPPVVAPRVPVSGAPPATRESRLDFGATLKLGSSGARVERLRLRLTELGFAVERTGSFDAALDAQVKAFQIQAGLAPDGMVDQQTVFNLNLGEADKARLLAEREQGLREILARHAQGKVIIVNIPSFRLLAFSDARQVLDSRVVVGNPGRPTPLMRTDLYAVTFNPGWSPPPAVLNKDLFTQDQPNHKKMAKLGLKLVNAEGRAVDVSEIDSRQTFQQGGYRFFQPPGSNNALGKLKFELRNDQQIYLHDTNQRNLFQRQTRAYSSGCVRVERYEDLAAWVLDTSVDEIRAQTGQRGTRTRRVEVVPVYLVYWLADHEQNRVVYYTDLYRQKKG